MRLAVLAISKEKGIRETEALKYIIQDIILKNVSSHGKGVLIGGCALIRGYQSPRFSEDVDLTGIHRDSLQNPLKRACGEAEALLGGRVELKAHGELSWRFIFDPDWSGNKVSVHVDTQPYRSHSLKISIIKGAFLPPFAISIPTIDELMAEKVIAIGCRKYFNGRDPFDIYYHGRESDVGKVKEFLKIKFIERELEEKGFIEKTLSRVENSGLSRAKDEWERYLPASLLGKNAGLLFKSIMEETTIFLNRLKDE